MNVSGGTWGLALENMSRLAMLERDAELGLLENALRGIETAGMTALVVGEPGIGKTRLCLELLRRADEQGCQILVGHASPATTGLALAPTAEAIGRYLDSVPDNRRVELLLGLDSLGLFLTHQSFPDHSGPAAALDWTRLFEAVAVLLERAAQPRPLVMFFDDLQWADKKTLQLLAFLAHRLAGRRVGLLLASRAEPRQSTHAALAESVRRTGSTVRLDRLSDESVLELAKQQGKSSPAGDSELIRRAAGLPGYVDALLRTGSTAPERDWTPGPGVPPDIFDRGCGRLRPLRSTDRLLMEALAVAEVPLPFAVLAAFRDLGAERCAASVRRLLETQLLERVQEQGGEVFQLVHPLYAEILDGLLLDGDRQRLHADLATALDRSAPDRAVSAGAGLDGAVSGGSGLDDPRFLGRLYLKAGTLLDGPRRAEVLTAAAERAAAERADGAVVEFLQPVLDSAGRDLPLQQHLRALNLLGVSRLRLGSAALAKDLWTQGLELASQFHDARAGESFRYQLMMIDWERGSGPVQPTVADRAVPAPPGDGARAADNALDDLIKSAHSGDIAQMMRAGTIAREYGSDASAAPVACVREMGGYMVNLLRHDVLAARAHASRAVEYADHSERPFLAMATRRVLSRVLILAGDLPGATDLGQWHLEMASKSGRPVEESLARSWLAALHYIGGDLRKAWAEAEAAAELAAAGNGASDRTVASVALLQGLLLVEQGDLRAAQFRLTEAAGAHPGDFEDYTFNSSYGVARSILALATGKPEEVPDPDPSRYSLYPSILCMSSLLAGLAGLDLAEPERATRQAAYLRSLGPESPLLHAVALRLDGLAAAAQGRDEAAAEMLLSASRRLGDLGTGLHTAQATLEWAEVASRCGREDVREALQGTLAYFEEQGITRWADRSRQLARQLGMRPPRRRPGDSPLTSREQEVARLVSEGLANGEIAGRLFLSERTVETHMRNIYASLGVSTRMDIAHWVQAQGGLSPGT